MIDFSDSEVVGNVKLMQKILELPELAAFVNAHSHDFPNREGVAVTLKHIFFHSGFSSGYAAEVHMQGRNVGTFFIKNFYTYASQIPDYYEEPNPAHLISRKGTL